MQVSRRFLMLGTASAAVLGASLPGRVKASAITVGSDDASKSLMKRMIKVAFPHKINVPEVCYDRDVEAIFGAANKDAGTAVMVKTGLSDLKAAGFEAMDDEAALAHLRSIEGTGFFQLMRGTTITTLYNDPEVWGVLGYEGESFSKGGYINRGFNDLDWLPDPRIDYL